MRGSLCGGPHTYHAIDNLYRGLGLDFPPLDTHPKRRTLRNGPKPSLRTWRRTESHFRSASPEPIRTILRVCIGTYAQTPYWCFRKSRVWGLLYGILWTIRGIDSLTPCSSTTKTSMRGKLRAFAIPTVPFTWLRDAGQAIRGLKCMF